jgi:hypothetical protein
MIAVPTRFHRMSRPDFRLARVPLRALAFACALAFVAFSAPATPHASEAEQAPRAVIELFTSQGCSACPPADAKLIEMAGDPDLIALTLHVDYWDYLGWEDTLAHAAFSERQRHYAEGRGDRGVFTPQMVVNGLYACIGSDPRAIEASLTSASRHAERLPVPLRLERDGQDLTITLLDGYEGGGELWLLRVDPLVTVKIERGENRGREAHYGNVVREMTRLTAWDGARMRVEARLPDGTGNFVVLVQHHDAGRPGRIIGAARGDGLLAAH